MSEPRDDRELLAGYADVWWQAVDDFTHLLEGLARLDDYCCTEGVLNGHDGGNICRREALPIGE